MHTVICFYSFLLGTNIQTYVFGPQIEPQQALPLRVRVMTMKDCSTVVRAPGQRPHHQIQLSVISMLHSLYACVCVWGVLLVCRRSDCPILSFYDTADNDIRPYIFINPSCMSRVWHKVNFKRNLTDRNSDFSF